jgi:predicted AlkP superfamily pyrophosphatase or phosphodiesterase
MTVVVFGIDALDFDLVDQDIYKHLTLNSYAQIETINSSSGKPSTHELWPTIITGLSPSDHGLQLEDGVAWNSPLLKHGSRLADILLPDAIQIRFGDCLLNNTDADAFQTPASYYENNDISTLFDECNSKAIGVPNYVVDTKLEDREYQLRKQMGDLFQRDKNARGGHVSSDPEHFYELCLEMSMVRTARLRRALRSCQYELTFGYTSGLDLIGHVSYDRQSLQTQAYKEVDEFVGELRADLTDDDELVLISDHGLQNGLHTEHAMIASTKPTIIEEIGSVRDIRSAIETELNRVNHVPKKHSTEVVDLGDNSYVQEQLKNLGYF